jgi:protein associated with RNAse G/E
MKFNNLSTAISFCSRQNNYNMIVMNEDGLFHVMPFGKALKMQSQGFEIIDPFKA